MLATSCVLTTAAYFHNTRLLRIFAVLAAILAAFLARTIACRVRALVLILVSHVLLLDPVRFCLSSFILELEIFAVKHASADLRN